MKFLFRWFWRLLGATVLALLLYQGWLYVQVLRLVDHNPTETALMKARKAEMAAAGEPARIQQEWVPISRISRYLQRALIVSEDATFYGHEGFDWEGIRVAAQKNWREGKVVAGGSTITQQLAKNLFLSTQRTPWRKAQEAVITVMLEKTLDKRRIFEIYLNVIEWGDGVFGAQAAAEHYYGKSAARLTPAQAAKLAAMVTNPRYYDKHRQDRHLQRKTRIILKRMGQRYGPGFDAPPKLIKAPPAVRAERAKPAEIEAPLIEAAPEPAPEIQTPSEPAEILPSPDEPLPLADPAPANGE